MTVEKLIDELNLNVTENVNAAYKIGMRKGEVLALDRVLKIIYEVNEEYMAWHGIIEIIRDRIMDFKGEQE